MAAVIFAVTSALQRAAHFISIDSASTVLQVTATTLKVLAIPPFFVKYCVTLSMVTIETIIFWDDA
jgi:hypothetical protein